jgi:dihydrofolate reductase
MGRKTWESIGRLLPGRTTVVVTRRHGYSVPGAIVADSLESALAACKGDNEIFVIGGAELFAACAAACDAHLSDHRRCRGAGDVHMPEFDLGAWRERSSQAFTADARNPFDYKAYRLRSRLSRCHVRPFDRTWHCCWDYSCCPPAALHPRKPISRI